MALNDVIRVTNIQSLRDQPRPLTDTVCVVEGHATAGDGGGGNFYWSPTSAEADNIGTILRPTAGVGNGRWRRSFSGPLNVRWFGARGDGVADDSIPINATILVSVAVPAPVLASVGVYIPAGNYRLAGPVLVLSGLRLEMDPACVLVRDASNAGPLIRNEVFTSATKTVQFSTTQNSSLISVTDVGHGLVVRDVVAVDLPKDLTASAITVGGIQLAGAYYVEAVTDANTYQLRVQAEAEETTPQPVETPVRYINKVRGVWIQGGTIRAPGTEVGGNSFSLFGDDITLLDVTCDAYAEGRFILIGGDRIRISGMLALNAEVEGGAGGIRYFGGEDFRCSDCYVESGDRAGPVRLYSGPEFISGSSAGF